MNLDMDYEKAFNIYWNRDCFFCGYLLENDDQLGIFLKILGNKKITFKKDLSEHRPFIDSLRKPAIRIGKGDKSSLSKIGGLPLAEDSFQWPIWKEKSLAFLCQINLDEIPKSEIAKLLPSTGILYFFYDQEQRTWGFDPKDRGSWKIIYISRKHELKPIEAPADIGIEFVYKEKYIKFSRILTYPDGQDDRIYNLDLNDSQSAEYIELCSSVYKNHPTHQLLGYPLPIQANDMDLESQLVLV